MKAFEIGRIRDGDLAVMMAKSAPGVAEAAHSLVSAPGAGRGRGDRDPIGHPAHILALNAALGERWGAKSDAQRFISMAHDALQSRPGEGR